MQQSKDFYITAVILCGMPVRKISLLLYLRMKEDRRKWWVTSHAPFALRDAHCYHGNKVIPRSGGSHFHKWLL